MKILLVEKFFYQRGGAETYFFALSELLAARGHQLVYFSMKDERNFACEQEQYFVPNVDYSGEGSLFSQLKSAPRLIYSRVAKKNIEELIKKEKPDIAHLNLIHRHITLSVVDVLKKYNIPMVHTVHDLICVCPNYTMLSPQGLCEKCLHGRFFCCVKQKCVKDSRAKSLLAAAEARFLRMHGSYNKIDLYITPSEFHQKKLTESGFTKSPVVQIYNFLPKGSYRQPSGVFGASGVFGDYLLFFGRLSREKGILTLLQAYATENPSLMLYIAGDGPEKESINEFIKANSLEKKVLMLGFCDREKIRSLILGARFVLVPSECHENCSYSIMESLAMSRPVIATNAGGNPELVKDGETGFLSQPFCADSLAKAINKALFMTESEHNEMCKRAFEFAKNSFDADDYIDKIEKLYKELILKKGANE